MKKHLLWFVILTTLSSSVYSSVLKGTAFEAGSKHTKPIFYFTSTDQISGATKTTTSRFTGLDGKDLAVEEIFFTEGKLTNYLVHHKQANEEGTLEVKDGKLKFSYTKAGKTNTEEEDVPELLVIGPTILDAISSHWDELMKGESVKFRFAVLDRKETVGFKIAKDSESIREGASVVDFKMKPTSLIISALVDPIHFILSKDKKEIIEIIGRTLPKKEVGGKLQDLDPEILYHRE